MNFKLIIQIVATLIFLLNTRTCLKIKRKNKRFVYIILSTFYYFAFTYVFWVLDK